VCLSNADRASKQQSRPVIFPWINLDKAPRSIGGHKEVASGFEAFKGAAGIARRNLRALQQGPQSAFMLAFAGLSRSAAARKRDYAHTHSIAQ
jgi:hypothetical protein